MKVLGIVSLLAFMISSMTCITAILRAYEGD